MEDAVEKLETGESEEADVELSEESFDEIEAGNPYDNSHILSGRMGCDAPVLDKAVEKIFLEMSFEEGYPLHGKRESLARANLGIVVLNCIVVHGRDPNSYIAYHRNSNRYNNRNKHLSFTIVAVIDALLDLGYLEGKKGFRTPPGKRGASRISRARPTEKFIRDYIEDLTSVSLRVNREVPLVELRNSDKYPMAIELEGRIEEMNNHLLSYLDVLENAEIALPPHIATEQKVFGREPLTLRRIFNRGSYSLGGRIYGLWWQRIAKEARSEIAIDGEETVELDYEAQHLNHLYARDGQSPYDADEGKDPYEIAGYPRDVVKGFVRIATNAESETKAYQALRDDFRGNQDLSPYVLTREAFERLRDAVLEAHPLLEKHLFSGVGLELQYEDSEVCMTIILELIEQGIPVLTIHDSFIVPKSKEAELRQAMEEAYSGRIDRLSKCQPRIK